LKGVGDLQAGKPPEIFVGGEDFGNTVLEEERGNPGIKEKVATQPGRGDQRIEELVVVNPF